MEKILLTSLKLNFSPNSLGCYGLTQLLKIFSGSPVEARGLTGRIITMSLFLCILFLYTSYAASIVALLQSPSTTIRSYADMLRTKIAVGAEDHYYNIHSMQVRSQREVLTQL